MSTDSLPRQGVCPEYQLLLEQCQKALVSWQQRRTLVHRAAFSSKSPAVALKNFHTNYARAHARLENHEHSCQTCQYISKIGGLDFDSMYSALDQYRRSA
jgi:hypothetical protein